jgi:UDP-N-acetylmuramate--alanine ligase
LVAGYDKTPSLLTTQLQQEGISVYFDENPAFVAAHFTQENTLVVFTPAVPSEHQGFQYFRKNDFKILKRAETRKKFLKSLKNLGTYSHIFTNFKSDFMPLR